MPVKISTYACEFRCGFIRTKRARVKKHEERCWRNPARRACASCRHAETEHDDNGITDGPYRHEWRVDCCAKEMRLAPTKTNQKGLRENCHGWEAKRCE